jgi:hypothetical protein
MFTNKPQKNYLSLRLVVAILGNFLIVLVPMANNIAKP